MARISEQEIERLKREISVERLVEARGIELKRHGADLIGLCPFHEDHEPSLVISPKKNLWHCLGACRAGGSVIDWVMRAEGVSFRHAVELLREDRVPADGNHEPVKKSTVAELPPPIERDADDCEVFLRVVDFYHESLKQSPPALKYLEQRGLKSSEMLERFKLGFANRTLGYRLPQKNRQTGAELRGRLQKLGILRENGHEHFNGSVVIPIFDLDDQVIEMYGRKITPGLRPGTPSHLYLPGPHRGVWNEGALIASKEIILCEALMDALTFWCAGYRHLTASYGVNGFIEDHKAAFKRHGTRKVFIAYDRDEAGEGAVKQLAEELVALGIDCYRVLFPKHMDVNEYALKVQPAPKSLGVLLNKAEWLGQGKRPVVTVSEAVTIRQGKGRKDRTVPIGERAIAWVEKYLAEARPKLVVEPDEDVVFLTAEGESFSLDHMTFTVRNHVAAAKLGKMSGCHLFRHTMATLMLEGGADIRFIQEMLSHTKLSTTQMYTQVSIRMLRQIHTATHPGAKLQKLKAVEDPGAVGAAKKTSPDRAEPEAALYTEVEEEKEN
ncbi:MAG: CHC2 zinc finger domain-containing protein [Terriglobia bacterium]